MPLFESKKSKARRRAQLARRSRTWTWKPTKISRAERKAWKLW